MSNINTKRGRLSRRKFLKGFTLMGTSVSVGLPPLISMFNAHGTAYAGAARERERAIETRFILWFNG
ncbi:MAG TPA: twin-arginine translocation signal domain-containing protein, partial [Blastocatellia bacterium]|nr:twin-arginine translocation signal domain-containing protein [Blastocatellia bacterium]